MTDSARPFSLYVHVPFCAQKCPYCDFNTYAVPRVPEDSYVRAVVEELRYFAATPYFSGREICTVFFGGGTPSLLSSAAIHEILGEAQALFPSAAGAEISLEANPSGVTLERLQGYRGAGINRLSFGVQSFDVERLRLLGRDHTPEDAREAVSMARAAGFASLSIDLIFGTPGQSVADLERDLQSAVELDLDHISTYALTIEPGTPFYQRQERGLLRLPPEERVVEMLERAPVFLAAHGYERYEISNYARPGYESRHNSAYWYGGDYLGVGAGAHSLYTHYDGVRRVSAERWSTYAQPERYMQAAAAQATVAWREQLDTAALRFEFLYLGLRRTEGVDGGAYARLFGEPLQAHFGAQLEALRREGYLEAVDPEGFRLTPAGIRLSDSVFERLVV